MLNAKKNEKLNDNVTDNKWIPNLWKITFFGGKRHFCSTAIKPNHFSITFISVISEYKTDFKNIQKQKKILLHWLTKTSPSNIWTCVNCISIFFLIFSTTKKNNKKKTMPNSSVCSHCKEMHSQFKSHCIACSICIYKFGHFFNHVQVNNIKIYERFTNGLDSL